MNSEDYNHLYNKKDPSSYSNPTEAISTSIDLAWDINFDTQTISGSVEHSVTVVTEGASHVDFDSSKINLVGDVLVNNAPGTFTAEPANKVLGTKISVDIPTELRKQGTTFTVKFNYFINTEASATQWLPASATKGQKHPYLFTQCQAIHARSLMPCQDSPGIKTQYTARITAPKWCTVLMSAIAESTTEEVADKNVFVWKQPNPTPAYLVALAAGRMESREISNRVRVWAEPEVVEAALFEFSETEEFVVAAEELTGCPYQWGRYDILCLPPSFPYGGMENPCLTFATPTLLAGDKSLADVIAHEIAHSWTGNLVTNHNWDHFWLNEGWTVWLERKIISKVRKNDEFGRLSSQVRILSPTAQRHVTYLFCARCNAALCRIALPLTSYITWHCTCRWAGSTSRTT
jgi:leukotriene-A4 hydrolase